MIGAFTIIAVALALGGLLGSLHRPPRFNTRGTVTGRFRADARFVNNAVPEFITIERRRGPRWFKNAWHMTTWQHRAMLRAEAQQRGVRPISRTHIIEERT